MTLETNSKSKKIRDVFIFIVLFFLIKEMTYILIEDYSIIKISFFEMSQAAKYKIQVFIFSIAMTFIFGVFNTMFIKLSFLFKLLFLVLAFLLGFYAISYWYSLKIDTLYYSNIKLFLFLIFILSNIIFYLFLKSLSYIKRK